MTIFPSGPTSIVTADRHVAAAVEEEAPPRVSHIPDVDFHSIAISCGKCRIRILKEELPIRLVQKDGNKRPAM